MSELRNLQFWRKTLSLYLQIISLMSSIKRKFHHRSDELVTRFRVPLSALILYSFLHAICYASQCRQISNEWFTRLIALYAGYIQAAAFLSLSSTMGQLRCKIALSYNWKSTIFRTAIWLINSEALFSFLLCFMLLSFRQIHFCTFHLLAIESIAKSHYRDLYSRNVSS